jgi:hypothetical protein
MVNYEPWYQGGYRRIPGYERFDGRPKPSDAAFTGWDSTDVSAATIGLVVTGDISGTTGVVCGIYDDSVVGAGYGTDTLAVTKVSGPGFQNGEGLNTGAYTINSAPTLRYAPTIDLEAEYLFNAETEYRDDIGEVTRPAQLVGRQPALRWPSTSDSLQALQPVRPWSKATR